MKNKPICVLDACVLYSAPLRDFLMWLAVYDLYRARWTTEIHDEWKRNLLKNRPDLTRKQLDFTSQQMDMSLEGCYVTDYGKLIKDLILPDPDDCHILAAAIKSDAHYIVTFNLKDYPKRVLSQYHIEAIHPDYFIESLLIENSLDVTLAAKAQRASLKNPPKSVTEFLEILENQKLTKTVKLLKNYKSDL